MTDGLNTLLEECDEELRQMAARMKRVPDQGVREAYYLPVIDELLEYRLMITEASPTA